ncbi:MAG: mevalonate kinase [Halobacteriovoraceae bacterium]|nr:mevalonate kinase [Halobacteriovoraceae bacterium]
MIGRKNFPSKILLFGEYTVIRKSNALAIPFELFEGRLLFKKSNAGNGLVIDQELLAFSKYLKDIDIPFSGCHLDVDSFSFDVSQGLSFSSSIPRGFGVGSSGALCSAIFQRYAQAPLSVLDNPQKMKVIFSLMENHFHGESSGIDPLISFYAKPILMDRKKDLQLIDILPPHKGEGEMFLLNTGRARRTEPLVSLFLEKCKSPDFISTLDEKLIPVNDKCIEHFLDGNFDALLKCYAELSTIQFEYFKDMIPKLFRPIWERGLESERYYLKLCGAGGGGFLLGFSKNLVSSRKDLEGMDIRPIRFNFLNSNG